VIFATFSDSTAPIDLGAVKAAFNGTSGYGVAGYFREASYGRMTVATSFFGPYVLDVPAATGCEQRPTQQLIDAAAVDVPFAQFSRLVYVYNCPNTSFGWAGSTGSVTTPQGTVQAAQMSLDGKSAAAVQTVAHELSHTFENGHAAFYVCLPEAFVSPSRFDDACPSSEYGDYFDVLGSRPPNVSPHLDPHHKANAGWFAFGEYPTVTTSGPFTLAPYERPVVERGDRHRRGSRLRHARSRRFLDRLARRDRAAVDDGWKLHGRRRVRLEHAWDRQRCRPAADLHADRGRRHRSPDCSDGTRRRAVRVSAASVSWAPSTDNVGVVGYRVTRNGTVLTTAEPPVTDVGLAEGTAYSYSVQAFDR